MLIPDTALGPLHVYDEGTITRALKEGQWWDDHLKPLIDSVEWGCAIDIGAHFGWFTIYLAQRFERVWACEPYPPSFELLTRNMRARPGLEHVVQAWPLAAYAEVTTLGFDPSNDTTDAGSFGFSRRRPTNLWVPAACLDDYLPPDADITLIKCDAQGADLKALQGLERTIARCRPLILFEWEEGMASWQGDVWQNYLDFFWQLNYTVDRITPDYWDFVARPRR